MGGRDGGGEGHTSSMFDFNNSEKFWSAVLEATMCKSINLNGHQIHIAINGLLHYHSQLLQTYSICTNNQFALGKLGKTMGSSLFAATQYFLDQP